MESGDTRSDQELVEAANLGEDAALETLYERHRDWVVATAFRLTGNREAALDCLQETFLHFVTRFPGFELHAQLKTYLYPVVRSAAVNVGRRRQRDQRAMRTIASTTAPGFLATDDADERRAALASVVERLPAGHREVLLLRFTDGLELQEIAQAIGIPLGTVKSRLHHALRTLRDDDLTKDYVNE